MVDHASGIDFSGVAKLGEFNPFIIEKVVSELSLKQKLLLRLNGNVEVGHLKMAGWRSELPCFLFKCEEHSYQINIFSGHYMTLHCPRCIEERYPKEKEIELKQVDNEPEKAQKKSKYEIEPLPLPNMNDYR
jgi:hypothetical protein